MSEVVRNVQVRNYTLRTFLINPLILIPQKMGRDLTTRREFFINPFLFFSNPRKHLSNLSHLLSMFVSKILPVDNFISFCPFPKLKNRVELRKSRLICLGLSKTIGKNSALNAVFPITLRL